MSCTWERHLPCTAMPGTFAKTLAATPGSGYWTPPEYISRCFSTDTRWCSNRSLTLSVLMVPDTPVCGHAVMLCMCSGTVAHADSSNVGWQRTPGYCRFPSCGVGCTHPPCKKSCGAAQVWKDKRLCKNPKFDGRCSQLSASSHYRVFCACHNNGSTRTVLVLQGGGAVLRGRTFGSAPPANTATRPAPHCARPPQRRS